MTVATTSIEAFARIAPALPERQRLVYEAICLCGIHGATIDEAAIALGVYPNAISGRFTELKRVGKIYATGERRKTSSGHSAMCWAVE